MVGRNELIHAGVLIILDDNYLAVALIISYVWEGQQWVNEDV